MTIHTSAFHFTSIENQVQIYPINVGVKFNLQLKVHKVHRFNNSLKFSSNTTEVGGSNDRLLRYSNAHNKGIPQMTYPVIIHHPKGHDSTL